MKNKLTNEEQLLQDKLNSVEFSYQDAHWAEMQEMMGKKGFFGKYGTLAKAGIGLLLIASATYLLNTPDPSDATNKDLTEVGQEIKEEISSLVETIEKQDLKAEQVVSAPKIETNNEAIANEEEATKAMAQAKKSVEVDQNDVAEAQEIQKDIPAKFEEKKKSVIPTSNKETAKLLDLIVNGKSCLGEKVSIVAQTSEAENIQYQWLVNDKIQSNTGNQLNLVLNEVGITEVEVRLIQNDQLIDQRSTNLELKEPVKVNFTYDEQTDAFYDLNATLKAVPLGLSNYQWQINKLEFSEASSFEYEFANEGIYDVKLSHTDDNGCVSSIEKPVSINEDFKPLVNAFSPNGDGVNDEFIPKVFTILKDVVFEMNIFDLKGQLIYQSNSINDAWNGRRNNNGELMPKGTYIWKVKIVNDKGVIKNFTERVKIVES